MRRFEKLDAMRGIFAVMVIFYHFTGDIFDSENYLSNFVFSQSYIFVDFFFVLSGFVIYHSSSKRIKDIDSFCNFLKRRFLRIYPLLFFSVILFSFLKIYGLYNGYDFSKDDYGWNDLILQTLDSLTFMNSNPILGSTIGMNGVTWTISAEMICYFLFGVVMLLNKKHSTTVFLVLHLICFAVIFSRGIYSDSGSFGFVRGILNFSIGVLTYKVLDRFTISNFQIPFTLGLIGVLFFIGVSVDIMKLFLPYYFGFGLLCFADDTKGSKFLLNPFFQFLGRISYSIYLNHYLVLWLVYFMLFRIIKIPYNFITIFLTLIISLVSVIFYSKYTYKYIEMGIKNRFSPSNHGWQKQLDKQI